MKAKSLRNKLLLFFATKINLRSVII